MAALDLLPIPIYSDTTCPPIVLGIVIVSIGALLGTYWCMKNKKACYKEDDAPKEGGEMISNRSKLI